VSISIRSKAEAPVPNRWASVFANEERCDMIFTKHQSPLEKGRCRGCLFFLRLERC